MDGSCLWWAHFLSVSRNVSQWVGARMPSLARNVSERVGIGVKTLRLTFRVREGYVVGTNALPCSKREREGWRWCENPPSHISSEGGHCPGGVDGAEPRRIYGRGIFCGRNTLLIRTSKLHSNYAPFLGDEHNIRKRGSGLRLDQVCLKLPEAT